jgi:hypothetical protein
MDRAFGTGCLAFLERAFFKALTGIVQKLFTFRAQPFCMMFVTV